MAKQFSSKWLILGIDLLTIAIAFVLAYFIRFNLSMNFDVSKLVWQLPMVLLIGLIAFVISGSYKGVFGETAVRYSNSIFKAVCVSSALIILLILINRNLEVFTWFSIPISIILIYSLLSYIGLLGSRYIFKAISRPV